MTAQVIFISQYQPDREELQRRMELQYFITGARNGLLNRVQGLGPYWYMMEKEKFHAYFREKIKLVNKYENNTN